MNPFLSTALVLGLAAPASAKPSTGEAFRQASALEADSSAGAYAAYHEAASASAGRVMDGAGSADTVVADGSRRLIRLESSRPRGASVTADLPDPASKAGEVPSPEPEGDKKSKLPSWAVYGGSAVLGAASGFFSAGLLGAAAGAASGLAAAWLFSQGDYGGAFGVAAGTMAGMAFGGPIGAVIGAVVGGLLGHFIGKLFL